MSENTSRREFLKLAGKGVLGAAALSTVPAMLPALAEGVEAPAWPWAYKKLDKDAVMKHGYECFYSHGGCCAGAVAAVVELLAEEYGYPYNQLNARMFADGAGGYGAAATYLLTRQMKQRGLFLLGARSRADVLLTDVYRAAGYEVRVATNDGSEGEKGFVTKLVEQLLDEQPKRRFFFYGCGPHPMLMALAKILRARQQDGELSIDHLMCCGVGACFACVVKVKADTPEGWQYARACTDGPVFKLKDVYVEQ